MQLGTLNTVFNLIVATMWFRIWNDNDRSAHFNPFLGPIFSFTEPVLNFLRPALLGAPDRIIATIMTVVLLVFRGLVMPTDMAWELQFGFEWRLPHAASVGYAVAFSFASFFIFLFKLWGLTLLYCWRSGPRGNSGETLNAFAIPFTRTKMELRPLVLAMFGLFIAALINAAGHPSARLMLLNIPPVEPAGAIALPAYLISTLAAWADVLEVLTSVVVLCIIGSLIGMFTNAPAIMMMCREWLDFLLGPLGRRRFTIGMFDLTPLLFILVVGFVHQLLNGILLASYSSLL